MPVPYVSRSPRYIQDTRKYLLRHIDFDEAQTLALRSLEAQMAAEVRHQVAAFMERRGMGGLIRGGL